MMNSIKLSVGWCALCIITILIGCDGDKNPNMISPPKIKCDSSLSMAFGVPGVFHGTIYYGATKGNIAYVLITKYDIDKEMKSPYTEKGGFISIKNKDNKFIPLKDMGTLASYYNGILNYITVDNSIKEEHVKTYIENYYPNYSINGLIEYIKSSEI